MRGRAWRALPLALLAATLLPLAPGRAAAQAGGLAVELAEISSWAGPDRPLQLRVAVRNTGEQPLDGLRLRVLAGSPVTTRSELHVLVEGAEPGGLRELASEAVPGTVAPGKRSLLPRERIDLPTPLGARQPGVVLPLVVQVSATTSGGRAVDGSLTTFAVYLSERVANPLRVSLLVPIHERAHRRAAGAFADAKLAGLLGPDGPLGRIARELARPDAPPVTLMLDGLLLEEAAAMAGTWELHPPGKEVSQTIPHTDPRSQAAREFLKALRKATSRAGNPPLAFPYAHPDLVALVRAELEAQALAQISTGRQQVENSVGTRPDGSVAWPPGGAVDTATLKTLAEAGARTVVLDSQFLPPPPGQTRNAPVTLEAGVGGLRKALVPDPALSAALSDPRAAAQPVAWAQRVLAETAIVWLERPLGTRPAPRGVLLAPRVTWRPHPAFFTALVRGLGSAAWLSVVPVPDLAEAVPAGPRAAAEPQRLAPYTPAQAAAELPSGYVRSLARTRERLKSFLQAAPGNQVYDDYSRLLQIAASSAYRDRRARLGGGSYLQYINKGLDRVYQKVTVKGATVTLTAREGQIPILVRNDSDQRLTVTLRLAARNIDLVDADQEAFTLDPHTGLTRTVRVSTRSTGRFPLAVVVLTPDGGEGIARAEITVVSTAFNRVALLLAGGAGGFLLVWWGRRLRRRQRAGVAAPQPGQEPAGRGGAP